MKLDLDIKEIFPNNGPARYNVAAWQKADAQHVVLLGREVVQPASKGQPDKGILKLYEIDEKYSIIHQRELWDGINNGLLLEDPRALVNPDGKITIGLTAVIKNDKGYDPYPAIVQIKSGNKWKGELPPLTIIHAHGPGKNLTPLNSREFLFRPESPDYFHKLMYFKPFDLDKKSTYDINFPVDIPWALWRIGTTMPPLWLEDNCGLLIIHGISIVQGKYIYSIGRAKICKSKGKFIVKVASDPIITPDTFIKEGVPIEEELHPELRKVVYACGGLQKRGDNKNLYLYVNVGDRNTYEVKLPLKYLQKDLF